MMVRGRFVSSWHYNAADACPATTPYSVYFGRPFAIDQARYHFTLPLCTSAVNHRPSFPPLNLALDSQRNGVNEYIPGTAQGSSGKHI